MFLPTISLFFETEEDATNAMDCWSEIKNLVLLVGSSLGCGSQAFEAIKLGMMELDENILIMDYNNIRMDRVIEDFNFKVSKYNLGVVPLDANFEASSNSIIKPSISLVDSSAVTIDCINCHSRGEAEFDLQVRGSTFSIHSYNLTIGGKILANLDMQLQVFKGTPNQISKEVVLYTIPINPIRYTVINHSVPGIFSLNNQFHIRTNVAYTVDIPRKFDFGFNVTFPFNFTMSSNNGLWNSPNFKSDATFGLNPHQPTLSPPSAGTVKTLAKIAPEFKMKFSLLNNEMDLNVAFSNSLWVDAAYGASAGCHEGGIKV